MRGFLIMIAIDPDVKKSGVAHDGGYKSMGIYDLYIFCLSKKEKVVIEAGWINNKSNFRNTSINRVSDRISKNVGQNQGYGMAIYDLLLSSEIDVMLVKPLTKKEFKTNGGWTKPGRQLFSQITGIKTPINDDCRDAVLLHIAYSK